MPRPTLEPRPTPVEGSHIPLVVDEFGFTAFPEESGNYASFGATLTNPNTEWAAYRMVVQVELFDATDIFVGGADISVTVLPGQTSALSGQVYGAANAVRMLVTIPEDPTPYVPFTSTGDMAVSDVTFTSDDSATRVTGTLTSSLASDQSFLQLFAVYRDAGGAIVGGSVGAVEAIATGASVPFEIIDSPAPSTAVAADVYWQLGGQLP
jgi:hypothetical protein